MREDLMQQAFPDEGNFGISIRDYFAARAMQGMLAACTGWSDAYQERMAKASYKMADEMLKERKSDE